jgi:putative redox protein
MKTNLKWKQNMAFDIESSGQIVPTDAKPPIGQGNGITPKEMLLAGIGGCTAMDVVALLKKHKQTFTTFNVEVDAPLTSSGYPAVFTDAMVKFSVTGAVDEKILLDSVMLSQTKYCGVSAMLSKAFPIRYTVFLNDVEIGSGKADFGS